MGMLTSLPKSGTGIGLLGDVAGGVGQLGGQYSGMINAQDQYKYQSQALRNEAILANRQAADIRRQGGREMQNKSQEFAQLAGAQRAALAANGVVVDQDTAAQLATDLARTAAMEKSTIVANAERQAVIAKYRGEIKTHQAKMAKAASKQALFTGLADMGSTIMTSGGSVAEKWLQLKKDGMSTAEYEAATTKKSERAHQALLNY